MSCGLWLKNLGYAPVIVERGEALGGQLLKIDRVNRWILGIPGRTGPELSVLFGEHVASENIEARFGRQLLAVTRAGSGFRLRLSGGAGGEEPLVCAAIVVATGLRVKSREIIEAIPGAQAVADSGDLSFFPLDHLDFPESLKNNRVAVIGGGDNAHFTVKDVALLAGSTRLIMRSKPRAQSGIRKEVESLIESGRVSEHRETGIQGLGRTQKGIEMVLRDGSGETRRVEVDRIFVRAGFAPNTECLADWGPLAELELNSKGYLMVDVWKRASLPSVYAIGDVCNPDHPSVVAAIADGAVAARAIAKDLGD